MVVVGLMGAGKSTVGRLLAARLGRPWRDSDAEIEAAAGLTVRELRDRDGVEAMHALEARHLLDALAAPEAGVISAAASVIDEPACRAALSAPAVTVIWLRARIFQLGHDRRAGVRRPCPGRRGLPRRLLEAPPGSARRPVG